MAMEANWVQPKFSSLDQISFTLTGLLVTCRGGSLVGEIASRRRKKKPPKLEPQSTVSREFSGPLGTDRELRNSLKFSLTPPPKLVRVKGASGRSTTFTGRSVRNCFRFDQKSSETKCFGAPKRGTALAGTGTISRGPVAGAFFLMFADERVTKESATCVPYSQPWVVAQPA